LVTADRDELRDHLTAVIEAARELPKEDRAYLADTFLDDLESRYQIMARSSSGRQRPSFSGSSWLSDFSSGWSPVRVGMMILAAMLLLPLLVGAFFFAVHPPVLILLVILFFAFRPGRRRGPRGRGPGGRMIV
jgi:hypothetical protein